MSEDKDMRSGDWRLTRKWPFVDKDGYYQAHKENGKWQNYWAHGKPWAGMYVYNKLICGDKDNSNVPDEDELNRTIPVNSPYWMNPPSKRKGALSNPVGSPGLRATWLGHATCLVEVDQAVVLADPLFSDWAGACPGLGSKRFRPPPCYVEDLPDKIHAVFVSHNHYDHLDKKSVRDLHTRYGDKLHWFLPMDMGEWFIRKVSGINRNNIHELVWWQEAKIPNTNVKIVCLPNNHWGRRALFDENKALWSSFAIIGPKSKFWHAGDTAYAEGVFKQIGKKYGPFDLASLPIGSYEPRWYYKHVHCNPAEAVQIHQEVKSKQSFGIHWGTFQSSHEYYLEPFTLTKEESEKAGLKDGEFAIIQLGNTIQAKVGGGTTKKKSKKKKVGKKKTENNDATVTTEEL